MVGDGRWWETEDLVGDGEAWWWWVDGHVMCASSGLEKGVRSTMLIYLAWRWVEVP